MITKQEIDKILSQVNNILQNYDERIKALEEKSSKPRATEKKAQTVPTT